MNDIQFPADAKTGDKFVVELGGCGVDSGQLMVIDPSYVEEFFDYERDVIERVEERYSDGKLARHHQLYNELDDGRKIPLGIIFSSGWGDGYYPLTATFTCFGEDHWRITKIEVDCGD